MARPVSITFITRPGCHLCDDALEVIERVRASVSPRIETSLEKLNILDDPELEMQYVEGVPVVLINDELFGFWHVDEAEFTSAVRKAARGFRRKFGRK